MLYIFYFRLVHGSAPKGLKQPFVPELRLLGCVEIDRVFALPLQKDMDLVPVPLNAKLKLQRVKNMEQLEHFIEYSRFLEKAQRLLHDARDRLQIVDMKLADKEKKESKFSSRSNKLPIVLSSSAVAATTSGGVLENGYVLRKSASCDSYNIKNQQQQQIQQQSSNIAEEYNEIDHIYDYVRGLTPLSKGLTRFEPICESPTLKSQTTTDSGNYCSLIRVSTSCNQINSSNNNSNNNNSNSNNNSSNNTNSNNYSSLESNKHNSSHHSSSNNHHHYHHHHHHHHSQQQQLLQQNMPLQQQSVGVNGKMINLQPHYNHSHIQEDIKPVPPPIETIPGKKLPEKRQRPTLPKLYVKNNNNSAVNLNSTNSHHAKVLITNNCSGNNSPTNGNSPLNTAINPKDCLEPQSPLFHIR